jgi:hypothetical protein
MQERKGGRSDSGLSPFSHDMAITSLSLGRPAPEGLRSPSGQESFPVMARAALPVQAPREGLHKWGEPHNMRHGARWEAGLRAERPPRWPLPDRFPARPPSDAR